MGGFEDNRRSLARFEGFLPTGNAKAPLIPGFEAAKTPLGLWGAKVIASLLRKGQKLGGYPGANKVQALIAWPGVTATGTKKPC